MGNAAETTAVNISLTEAFADLALSLQDCLLAVEASRAAHRSSLPAVRLAARCLGAMFRLAHWQPTLVTALLTHLQHVLAAATREYQAARDAQRDPLGFLAVRITCQTYLTRLAEQQARAAKLADRQHQRTSGSATPTATARPVTANHGYLPSAVYVGDLATTPLAQMPPAVAAYVYDKAGIKSPPPAPPLTQRAQWLANKRSKRNQQTTTVKPGDT